MRSSAKSPLSTRIEEEIFGNHICETLRFQIPNEEQFRQQVINRVMPIQGNIVQERQEISDKDHEMIHDTTFLVNCAASVNFEGSLRIVLSPFEAVTRMHNLKKIFHAMNQMSDDEINLFKRTIVLKTNPTTYSFTKSLVEHLIQSRYQPMSLPIITVRPPGVAGALEEPVPGWSEGLGATLGIMANCGLGHVQEWAADEL
ncbi:hypothetical protein BC939DRAFT_498466 [Gamsiella multidivaricata]|uniref:uncharacterized protein n=1 Tax=Gamsiella multidivaricata TaxID=101098 RepID=UPI0022208E3B|nr:uncharacterized protein BC939DRAFT_498466 [Gamsiella multidivaricata]KAG0367788.1 cyclin-dependent kinase inhibitor far1 [Gamsiella multidivaricata]KAI7832387.1 hypothetical protein BC939DRAFT_498466 [Gamsiella multidivaricata]